MTVCMAAVCHHGGAYPIIIGVSDRKFTVGDWTYEPEQAKRYNLTDHVVILVSGDITATQAMCASTSRKLAQYPTVRVSEMAKMLAESYVEYRRRQAERFYLAPLGLTLETYRQEDEHFASDMDDKLRRFELSEAFIVAGFSYDGAPHIWTVTDPGWANCEDAVGYGVIGSGRRHAGAEFMRANFNRSWSVPRTLLLAYRAKKSAEVDPYVGKETDIMVIDATGISGINEDLRTGVEAYHEIAVEAQKRALLDADENIEAYVEAFLGEQKGETDEQGSVEDGQGQRQLEEAAEAEPTGTETGEPED